jgi:hypothetical protein
VAGDPGVTELSPRSVRAPQLSGLFVRRAHQSHVLYGRRNGRRFAVYVPEDLVGEVRRGVDNGRAPRDLLVQAGPRYVKALKRARASASKSKNRKS